MLKHRKTSVQLSGRLRPKAQSNLGTRYLRRSKLKEYKDKPFVLIRSEKYEQFLQKLGAKEEIFKLAAKAQPTLTLKIEGDDYALVTTYPDFPTQIVKFKVGEVIQRELHDGTIVESLFDIKDNTIKEVQQWNGRKVVISRYFLLDELIVSMEVDGVKCFRHYKNKPSKQSIGTETSRRKSLFQTEVESEVLVSPPVESVIEGVNDSQNEMNNVCL